jgi:hypothetical protein
VSKEAQNDSDLKLKVKEWLSTQGFPFEMRVAAQLQDAGFQVVQSAYFGDPSTAKARELCVLQIMSPCFSKFCHPLRASLFC